MLSSNQARETRRYSSAVGTPLAFRLPSAKLAPQVRASCPGSSMLSNRQPLETTLAIALAITAAQVWLAPRADRTGRNGEAALGTARGIGWGLTGFTSVIRD